jgi:hypothetical protein
MEDSGVSKAKKCKVKVMLTVSYDHEGVVRHEYAPECRTVNRENCIEVLPWLHDVVQCKLPVLWKGGDWQLHHDITSVHLSHLIQNFLAKCQIPQVPQSPYSLDIARMTFYIPKGENAVEGE